MNKFLVDESSGIKLYQAILDNNYNVKFVSEVMPGVSDIGVLNPKKIHYL